MGAVVAVAAVAGALRSLRVIEAKEVMELPAPLAALVLSGNTPYLAV